jgi:peptidoglycan/LPS O-acetylase OafA/YrhL
VWAYRYRLLNGWAALALVLAAAIAAAAGYRLEELWSLAVAYGVLWLGFAPAPALLAYNRAGDYSYGTYIYGFVVQQIVAALVPGITPAGMIALSLPLAIGCGAASWYLVERPALRLRLAARPGSAASSSRSKPTQRG